MAGLTPEQGRILFLGAYSDLTLVCKEVQFKVHKNIVCVASPIIVKYIQIPDPVITPVALARLLQELCTRHYPVLDAPVLLKTDNAARATKPATPASYDMEDLNTRAKNEVELYVSAKALEVEHVMLLARATVSTITSRIFERANALTGFADVLAFVFESTKSGHDVLREMLITQCLRQYSQCSKNAAIVAVLEEHERSLWKIAVPLLHDADAVGQTSAAAAPTLQFPLGSIPSFAPKQPSFDFKSAPKSVTKPFVPSWEGTTKFPYVVTEKWDGEQVDRLHSISCMPAYQNFSIEELRLADYDAGRGDKAAFTQYRPDSSFSSQWSANPFMSEGLFDSKATNTPSGRLSSTPLNTNGGATVPKAPSSLFTGSFGCSSSGPPSYGLFGDRPPANTSGGLFGKATASNSSGAFGGFTFDTSTPVKPSTGLSGNKVAAPGGPSTQATKPAPSSSVQKPVLTTAASGTEGVSGTTGNHN